jgi:hypothetical protein
LAIDTQKSLKMNRFPAPIDHCYILCNPAKEPDRARYLTNWLQENRIDPACYTLGTYCYGSDPFFQTDDVWKMYDPWSTRFGRRIGNSFGRNMKPAELSLILNFAAAAKQAVDAKHEIVMILESDVIFFDGFFDNLKAAMQKLEGRSWDFLSLSASANLRPNRKDAPAEELWFPPLFSYYHTRCTDSMVFRVEMLDKILRTIFPCVEPLDWELNFQLSLHKSNSLWLDPPIMRQASGINGDDIYETVL